MLSSAYYKIPRFQRPYSWDRENIQEFWEDVIQDNPQDYFIGSMVVYKDGKQRYGVVDGQQRLTTITILLSVLRDKLADVGLQDLAEGVHGLIERRNIDNKPEFIVSTESSYPYFQDRIQKWGTPSLKIDLHNEELNLQSAHAQLGLLVSTAIESLNKDTTLSGKKRKELIEQKLVAIRDALLNLKVILVKLEDEDDAYVIFETLNTRGKDLALTDLVKNHLTKHTKHIKSKNPSSDEVKVKWKQLLETIEGSSADLETNEFIHHFWLSKYDYLPAKSLFKVLKKRITADQSSAFLDALLEDAVLYRSMNEPSYGKWAKEEKEIERVLSALVTFRVVQQTPCVLSLLREYRTTKKLKKRHVEDAIVAIEKFHFLFTAATSQRSSGGISGMYAALGRRLFEAKDTQDAVKVIQELKQRLRDRVPSIEEFRALFPNIVFTDNVTKQKKLVRYVLVCLDRQSANPAAVDYQQMTIEHLAAQSLIGSTGYDDALIGQSGNLLLVSEDLNGKLKNKPFKEKKLILREKGYTLPKLVEQAATWGATEIKQRTDAIADDAYNTVWKP